MNRPASLLASALLLAAPLRAGGLAVFGSAGPALQADSRWHEAPGGYAFQDGLAFQSGSVPYALEAGLEWSPSPAHRLRLSAHAADTAKAPFRNQAVSALYLWAPFRWGDRALYGILGLSRNRVSGTYEVRPAWGPSDPGLYVHLDQSGRLGARAGAGCQVTPNFAVEAVLNVVTLDRPYPGMDDRTSYVGLGAVLRSGPLGR